MNVMEFMSQDHDRLDDVFKTFKQLKNEDISKATRFFEDFKQGLEQHIIWEEEILFPVFETKTGMRQQGPTIVMKNEHEQIKGYLKSIYQKIKEGNTDTDELEEAMFKLLKNHNGKEENVLYPSIDDMLDQSELEDIMNQMKE